LGFLASTLYLQGRLDAAREVFAESEARGRRSGRAYELAMALMQPLQCPGLYEPELWFAKLDELDQISQEHGFPLFGATAMAKRGSVFVEQGRFQEGARLLRDFLSRSSSLGLTAYGLWTAALATAQIEIGLLEEAEATLEGAVRPAGAQSHLRIVRIRGDLRMRRGDTLGAEVSYREALEGATHCGARLLAIEAATALARLLLTQTRTAEAREILAPIYASFSEGFDTRMLIEAKTVLDALGTSAAT
jgi:tetratricopeptide (TPR) repeat protein